MKGIGITNVQLLQSFSVLVISLTPCLSQGICSQGCSKNGQFPVLNGPYLGQKPPGMKPEIFAPGIVTIEDRNELNAVFSLKGDEFYFAVYTAKPINTCVIMVSQLTEGTWTRPQPACFSGKGVDVDMAFGPDGNRLYFCSVAQKSKHDIWFVDRQKNNSWSQPKRLGPLVNTGQGETYPTFTLSGRMYFSAIRPEGLGGKDLYYSDQVNKEFTNPVNLGEVVNSHYEEGDTFVAPDESYLIISSTGRPDSIGASDLYVSFRQVDGSWTTPKNLGDSINTKMYEYSPMVSPDGKYLFFSRFFGGRSDIYWVDSAVVERLNPKGSTQDKGRR